MATDQHRTNMNKLAQELSDGYERYKRQEIKSRRFNQSELIRWIEPMVKRGTVDATVLGRSAEGRPISMYTHGKGPVKVLLWSQMHGDEPTATMALLDILNFLAQEPEHAVASALRTNLTLLIIPMLNPDGAERFTRRTAQLVDMNRDAVTLCTPEAQILKAAQHRYQPQFGFNLHDQDPRLTVGGTKNVTAVALLAPAKDVSRSDDDTRLKAKKVAGVLAEVLELFVPGHVAKYDDTFDRRAFGDSIQSWGTSTVLVESGGWPNDRDKMFIRKLNYVGLVTSLFSIASGEFESASIAPYESLQFNTKNLYDIIVRGVQLKAHDQTTGIRVDIGMMLEESNQDPDRKRMLAKVVDVGDLSTYGAFREIRGERISIKGSDVQLDRLLPLEDLQFLLK